MIVCLVCCLFGSWAGAQERGMRIICDQWPPYSMEVDDRVSGFSTQVVETVFRRMEVAVDTVRVYPWRRAVMMIADGSADALFSANYTEQRASFAYYPEEMLVQSPWVLWVRQGDSLIFETLEDLADQKIGVVLGYSYTAEFWNFLRKHQNFEEVVSDVQNFSKLDAGRISCAVAELNNGNYIKKRLRLDRIRPLTRNPIKTDGLYIIFSKKSVSETFVRRFSDALKQFKMEPLYQRLYQQYLGLD
jgi:polar amino acid transport system substrate-binding protein